MSTTSWPTRNTARAFSRRFLCRSFSHATPSGMVAVTLECLGERFSAESCVPATAVSLQCARGFVRNFCGGNSLPRSPVASFPDAGRNWSEACHFFRREECRDQECRDKDCGDQELPDRPGKRWPSG